MNVRSDALSSAARAVHELGVAALIGGNLFARTAMHPALADIGDERERGKVLNHAWRRYGFVNSAALGATVIGWAGARAGEVRPALLSGRERRLAAAKDVAVGATALTGVASAIAGVGFARAAPEGAVPMSDGDDPAAATPPGAARLKRVATVMGTLHLASAVGVVAVNASLAQTNFRRPPARRFLRRRW